MTDLAGGRPGTPGRPIFQLGLAVPGAFRRCPRVRRYHSAARAVGFAAAGDRLVGEVVLTDANGQPLLVVDGVEMAVPGSGSGATELTNRLFMLEWSPHRWKRPLSYGCPVADR